VSVGPARATLRRRWLLTIVGLVGALAVIGPLASLEIGLWGASVSGEEWLRSNYLDASRAYNDFVYDALAERAHMVQHDLAVTAAAARADDAALARVVDRELQAAWLVLTPNRRVLSGLDVCRELDGAALVGLDRGIVMCRDTPLLAARAREPATAGYLIFSVQRMDDDVYLEGFQVTAKSEVVILGRAGVVATTVRDVDGRPMEIALGDALTAPADRPPDEAGFVRTTLGFPRPYGGFLVGSAGRVLSRGAMTMPAYVLAGAASPQARHVPITVAFFVPSEVLEAGPTFAALVLAAISLLTMVLLVLVGWRLVRRFTAPLETLASAAAQVGEGNLDVRVPVLGADAELATLAESFNDMLAKLGDARRAAAERAAEVERRSADLESAYAQLQTAHTSLTATQEQLATASRRAGMADVAAGVLHNVGNVLNSVNVSAGLLVDRVRGSKVERVGPVAELLSLPPEDLSAFLTADPRGRQIVPYLRELGRHVLDERDQVLAELAALQAHVDHVKAVVASQHAYAKSSVVLAWHSPNAVVEDAVRFALTAAQREEAGFELTLDAPTEIPVDRHKLVQIAVNLIVNAHHAVAGLPAGARRVHVSVCREDEALVLEVEDNGVGVAAEELARVFAQGYTTRPDGHGLGLHTSALAVAEMGGTLRCFSEGAGQGARFRLTLPAITRYRRCA